MPIKLNPRLVEIQSMSEAEQLEMVHWNIEQLEFAINFQSHPDEIRWAVELEHYRDCTQYPNVEIDAGCAVQKYWDSYTVTAEEIKE